MGSKEFSRSERVGDQIQRELALVIATDLDDPRVGSVTLSGVRVSKDLGFATVYVTLPEASDAGEVLRALTGATGYLRRRLAARLRMRYVPRLRFTHDSTLDDANRIDALLDAASAAPGRSGGPGDGEEV